MVDEQSDIRGEQQGSPGRERFAAYRPAIVISLIVAVAAGLFAGAYSWAMAHPVPHYLPTGVTGDSPQGQRFVESLERGLGASLVLHDYPDVASAHRAIEQQRDFALVVQHDDRVELRIASASGASVARVLSQAASAVSRQTGVPVTVVDAKPLPATDPQGLVVFYVALASVVLGFVGAIQLSVHARRLNAGERIGFTAGYALLAGLAIYLVVDVGLGALSMPFPEGWLICALTMFTAGMVFTAFNTMFGRWAILPTWGVMILLGSPSSGGAVAWPLLPPLLGVLGRFLPPGAAVNAQRNAAYFPDSQHIEPFLVLGGWALAAALVFVIWRERHPGGR